VTAAVLGNDNSNQQVRLVCTLRVMRSALPPCLPCQCNHVSVVPTLVPDVDGEQIPEVPDSIHHELVHGALLKRVVRPAAGRPMLGVGRRRRPQLCHVRALGAVKRQPHFALAAIRACPGARDDLRGQPAGQKARSVRFASGRIQGFPRASVRAASGTLVRTRKWAGTRESAIRLVSNFAVAGTPREFYPTVGQ
jgi:hypothetical protein